MEIVMLNDDGRLTDADRNFDVSKPKPELSSEPEAVEAIASNERFRAFSEPIVGRYYLEGQIPFGISYEEAMKHVPDRILEAAREDGISVDIEYLEGVQSVLDQINAAPKTNFSLGLSSVSVIEYHLAIARGDEPDIDISSFAFLYGEMGKNYKKMTGKTLSEWATNYVAAHESHSADLESVKKLFDIYDKDFDRFRYTVSSLSRVIGAYIRIRGDEYMGADEVMKALHSLGFLVPAEWQDEYAETDDGKTLLSAIEVAKRRIHEEDLADVLAESLAPRPKDELIQNPYAANNVLAMASFESVIPKVWNECDNEIKATVKNAMKIAADRIGAIIVDTPEGPTITFPENK